MYLNCFFKSIFLKTIICSGIYSQEYKLALYKYAHMYLIISLIEMLHYIVQLVCMIFYVCYITCHRKFLSIFSIRFIVRN